MARRTLSLWLMVLIALPAFAQVRTGRVPRDCPAGTLFTRFNFSTGEWECAALGTVNTVAFSATPTFDAALGSRQDITLTDNVTSSTLSNAASGQQIDFLICQDGTGSRTFAWPAAPTGAVLGGMVIGATAGKCSAQSFTVKSMAAVTVQNTGDTVTLAGHPFSNGNVVVFNLTANGITAGTNYWVCNKAADTFRLDAVGAACGSLLTITSDGTNYITGVTTAVRTAYAVGPGVTNM